MPGQCVFPKTNVALLGSATPPVRTGAIARDCPGVNTSRSRQKPATMARRPV